MKYLLLLLLWGYNAGAQVAAGGKTGIAKSIWHDTVKCKHIYVATLSPEIKIEQPIFSPLGGMGIAAPGVFPVRLSGKHEGQEIVCVKCHHVTKQVLDYGPPDTAKTLLQYPFLIPQYSLGEITDTVQWLGDGSGGSFKLDSTIGETLRLSKPCTTWFSSKPNKPEVRKKRKSK